MRWCMLRNDNNLGQIIAACLLCLKSVRAAPAVISKPDKCIDASMASKMTMVNIATWLDKKDSSR